MVLSLRKLRKIMSDRTLITLLYVIFLLVCAPLIKLISDKWCSNKKPKQFWFNKKVLKAQKKYYKRTVKDIKKENIESYKLRLGLYHI